MIGLEYKEAVENGEEKEFYDRLESKLDELNSCFVELGRYGIDCDVTLDKEVFSAFASYLNRKISPKIGVFPRFFIYSDITVREGD